MNATSKKIVVLVIESFPYVFLSEASLSKYVYHEVGIAVPSWVLLTCREGWRYKIYKQFQIARSIFWANYCFTYTSIVHVGQRLTGKDRIKVKRQELELKTEAVYWRIRPESEFNLRHICILHHPVASMAYSCGLHWISLTFKCFKYFTKFCLFLMACSLLERKKAIQAALDIQYVKNLTQGLPLKYLTRFSNHLKTLGNISSKSIQWDWTLTIAS